MNIQREQGKALFKIRRKSKCPLAVFTLPQKQNPRCQKIPPCVIGVRLDASKFNRWSNNHLWSKLSDHHWAQIKQQPLCRPTNQWESMKNSCDEVMISLPWEERERGGASERGADAASNNCSLSVPGHNLLSASITSSAVRPRATLRFQRL